MNRCRRYEEHKIINIILENHFEKFKQYKLPSIKSKEMRQHIINVIEKALNCGNIEHGYIKHKCLNCDEKQADNMLNVKHRHVVHTFGSDLKWNPHIHALISEGGAGNITPWRPVKHFDYNFLRNAFRKVLLERLTSRIGPAFRKVKNEMYTKHADGFYVRAKPNLCTPDITIKYISRYLGRPVIATSRIDTYDGENVTFHYTRHEDNKTVTETIPALNFIQKLIVHIPEKHFKMLRYYGIYAKHHKQEMKLRKCISAEKQRFLRSIQDWRQSILLSFGYDPLCCSECGTSMLVLEVYHKKTALFEQYRKVMGYG